MNRILHAEYTPVESEELRDGSELMICRIGGDMGNEIGFEKLWPEGSEETMDLHTNGMGNFESDYEIDLDADVILEKSFGRLWDWVRTQIG
jgi:hypothetical protein